MLLQSGDPEHLVGQLVKYEYDIFLYGIQAFINRNALEAVDERKHDQTTHMAMAISVHDLIGKVSKDLLEGTSIPSENYLRLQFWPTLDQFCIIQGNLMFLKGVFLFLARSAAYLTKYSAERSEAEICVRKGPFCKHLIIWETIMVGVDGII